MESCIPEPAVVNAEQNFFHWAHQVAFHTQDREKSLHMLIAQWKAICQDANEDELQTAVSNLRGILGMAT